MAASLIAVDALRIGMYIHLEGGWLSHPFPLSSFKLSSQDQIETVRKLGLAKVRWYPEKSDPEPDAAAAAAQEAAAAATAAALAADADAARPLRERLARQREAQQVCERQYGEASGAWKQAWELVTARPEDAGRGCHKLAQAMIDKMLDADDVAIRLVGGGGDRAAAHALNVTVISLLMGRALSLPEADLVELAVGALMHDVGKLDVAERFRHADDRFTTAEMNAYRDHVAKGIALGRRMGLPAGALSVIAQHHEQADGNGFPQRLAGERQSIGARIVAIVNRYDNLCNPATRTLALTPHEAVSMLFAQGRNRFDATVLNTFIRMMGVYPAGSLVQLTDDRYAMVVGINASRPLKPCVLVHDARVPRADALLLELEHTPDLGIRRSLQAAKLPPQALEYLDPRPRVNYYFEPLERAEELAA